MFDEKSPFSGDEILNGAYFQPGADGRDVLALYPLLQAKDQLEAFGSLFRGDGDGPLIRLLVLREMGTKTEPPTWTASELRAWFHYLDTTKLETVMSALRQSGLIAWDIDHNVYRISPNGRMALAAVATLLQYAREDAGDLGYITSQLAAGQEMGGVSIEVLQSLLGRLNELYAEFEQAVSSGSEHRVRLAEAKLNSVWTYVEKGTVIIATIMAGEPTTAAYRTAQQIGRVQSRILNMTAVFQRTLNQMERHRIHIGQSGLSSSDISQWLRATSVDRLAQLAERGLSQPLYAAFLLSDILLDVAEYELVERERERKEDFQLPDPSNAPEQSDEDQESFELLKSWLDELQTVSEKTPLSFFAADCDFSLLSYRFSLLPLIGDRESTDIPGPVADLARLRLSLEVGDGSVAIEDATGSVAEVSQGWISPFLQEKELNA